MHLVMHFEKALLNVIVTCQQYGVLTKKYNITECIPSCSGPLGM